MVIRIIRRIYAFFDSILVAKGMQARAIKTWVARLMGIRIFILAGKEYNSISELRSLATAS